MKSDSGAIPEIHTLFYLTLQGSWKLSPGVLGNAASVRSTPTEPTELSEKYRGALITGEFLFSSYQSQGRLTPTLWGEATLPGRAPKPMHVATFILPSGPISLHTSQTAEPPVLTANLRKVRKELK